MFDDQRLKIVSWVSREVLPHEGDVRKWLRRSATRLDAEDVVQEAYCRISNLKDIRHIRNGRAYFFQVAKSIVIDQMRRSKVVHIEIMAEIDTLSVEPDGLTPERIVLGREELKQVYKIIESLPERCRKIVKLRKLENLPQRQVAQMLGISESIVENDIAKAIRLILEAIQQGETTVDSAVTRTRNVTKRSRLDQRSGR